MSQENKETPGGATPKTTVNIPCEKHYTAQEVDNLLMTVTRNSHVNIVGFGKGYRAVV